MSLRNHSRFGASNHVEYFVILFSFFLFNERIPQRAHCKYMCVEQWQIASLMFFPISSVRFACINLRFPHALHTVITLINRCQGLIFNRTIVRIHLLPIKPDWVQQSLLVCVSVCAQFWTLPQTRPCACRRTAGSSRQLHRCC